MNWLMKFAAVQAGRCRASINVCSSLDCSIVPVPCDVVIYGAWWLIMTPIVVLFLHLFVIIACE